MGHIFTSKIVDSRHVNWGIEKGMAKYENIIKKKSNNIVKWNTRKKIGLKKRFNLSEKVKKDYVRSFKELYSRDPSDEELYAFIKMNKEKKQFRWNT